MIKKFGLLFCFSMIVFQAGSAVAASPTPDQQTAFDIIFLINSHRSENSLNPYEYNQTLANVAQAHSEYQASIDTGTHTGAGGTTSSQRVGASGYGEDNAIRVDEMIYSGQFTTPQKAVEWWKNSSIHNAIMLSTEYHQIGVGVATSETHTYYTVNVARITGVTSPIPMGTLAPNIDEMTTPVETAEPGEDGSIYHQVIEGQTIEAIANAYQVPVNDLRIFNNLSEGSSLTVGTLLVIKPPDETPTQETKQGVEPTDESITTATAESVSTVTGDTTESPTESAAEEHTSDVGQPTSVENQKTEPTLTSKPNQWLLYLIGFVVLVAAIYLLVRGNQVESPDDDEGKPTSSFHTLSRKRQLTSLENLAENALTHYPLEVVHIELLRYALNVEFIVAAHSPGDSGSPGRYVLRINAPGFHTKAEICSELDWLHALNKETDLVVPNPIPRKDGGWVTTSKSPGVPESRDCVLFEYIPGSTIEKEISIDHLEKVGKFIAKIHAHGSQFTPPDDFTRKHWDLDGLTGEILDVPVERAYAGLNVEQLSVIKDAQALVIEATTLLRKNPQVYGLIHADLHEKSYLFQEDKAFVLDFDTCGYGYYIYDLAVPIWNLIDHDDFDELKPALMRGYRRVRPITELEENLMKHFVAGRLMIHTLTLAAHRNDPAFKENASEAIDRQIELLEVVINIARE